MREDQGEGENFITTSFIRLLNEVGGSRRFFIPLKIRGIKGVMSVSRLRFHCLFVTPLAPLILRGEP
jgi:hypothetical protein